MMRYLRAGVAMSHAGAALDGNINQCVEAALAQKAFGEAQEIEDVE